MMRGDALRSTGRVRRLRPHGGAHHCVRFHRVRARPGQLQRLLRRHGTMSDRTHELCLRSDRLRLRASSAPTARSASVSSARGARVMGTREPSTPGLTTAASTRDSRLRTPESAGNPVGLDAGGNACTFNHDCLCAERCECDDVNGCFCAPGPRGTGRAGVDPCTTGNDCESSVCAEGWGSFYCSGECTTGADCGSHLPRCTDVAFIGRILRAQSGRRRVTVTNHHSHGAARGGLPLRNSLREFKDHRPAISQRHPVAVRNEHQIDGAVGGMDVLRQVVRRGTPTMRPLGDGAVPLGETRTSLQLVSLGRSSQVHVDRRRRD